MSNQNTETLPRKKGSVFLTKGTVGRCGMHGKDSAAWSLPDATEQLEEDMVLALVVTQSRDIIMTHALSTREETLQGFSDLTGWPTFQLSSVMAQVTQLSLQIALILLMSMVVH